MAEGIASFDYTAWITRYPEFASVSEERAAMFWGDAEMYIDNTAASPIPDVAFRGRVLGMLTAHIAELAKRASNGGLVGRISSASQGSISVSTDAAGLPGTAAWFAQTTYGMSAWQATARFRMARYFPGPRPYLGTGRFLP